MASSGTYAFGPAASNLMLTGAMRCGMLCFSQPQEGAMARSINKQTNDLFAYADDNLTPTVVYIATNKLNGKRYIGITRQELKKRQTHHFYVASRLGTDSKLECVHFHRAIKLHGRDAFEWTIVATCSTFKEAAKEEIRLISLLKPEYNISGGGDGVAGVGYRPSKATLKKMSVAKIGRPGPWTGKKRSPESIAKRTATRALNPVRPWLGKKRDPATIEKIALTKRKWVVCVDDGKRYHGLRAAAEAYGIPDYRDIASVCNGRNKTIYGHRFRYDEVT